MLKEMKYQKQVSNVPAGSLSFSMSRTKVVPTIKCNCTVFVDSFRNI